MRAVLWTAGTFVVAVFLAGWAMEISDSTFDGCREQGDCSAWADPIQAALNIFISTVPLGVVVQLVRLFPLGQASVTRLDYRHSAVRRHVRA